MTPLLWLGLAAAHTVGLSAADLRPDAITLTFAATELGADPTRLGAAWVADVRVHTEAGPCVLGAPTAQRVAEDGLEVRATLACPPGEVWTYEAGFLSSLSPGHRHHLTADGVALAVLDAGQPAARLRPATATTPAQLVDDATTTGVFQRFFALGVEHIWTGYDHLAFLFVLLLAARSFPEMLGIITGFTVGHSVTLGLGATGLVVADPGWVEPAIALTIAWAGIENLWAPPARRRIVITTGLGLIHGFGFAGLLAELGLPPGAQLSALLAFNLGVEVGQAAVAAAALPVLLQARTSPAWVARAIPGLSLAAAATGLWLFGERIAG